RNARRAWINGEAKEVVELVEEMGAVEDPLTYVQAVQGAEKIAAQLSETEAKVAELQARGTAYREIKRQLKIGSDQLDEARIKIRELQHLLPDSRDVSTVLRAVRTPPQTDMGESSSVAHNSWIDTEIAKLEHTPQGAQDCLPCWRCKWFEGY